MCEAGICCHRIAGSHQRQLRLRKRTAHYNYYRDYDPAIGRYGKSDPIGVKGGTATYSYVLNNPLRFVDPPGLAVYRDGSSYSDDPSTFGSCLVAIWSGGYLVGWRPCPSEPSPGPALANNNSTYDLTCDVAGSDPDPWRDLAKDVVVDILTDPTTYIPVGGLFGALGKFGKKFGKFGKFKGTDALRRENKVFRDATAGLTQDQRQQVHREVSGQGLSFEDIRAIAERIKNGG
jgi:RHS repeat-associated protein